MGQANPGANPFSDAFLPLLQFQQSLVQKNEPHHSQLYFDHLTIQMMATILYSVNRYKYMPYGGFGIACF
jgi:hypothetical protein